MRLIRSRAPLRISFAGGGTDVQPYPKLKGGCILSATIDRYAYVTIAPRRDSQLAVHSLDYGVKTKFRLDKKMIYDGELDLIKATFRVMKIRHGCELFIHADAPPGSGLGTSSTLVVAIIGAIAKWKRLALTPYEIADLAYQIEREELKIAGGMQDQYAAAFGGFNFIEFLPTSTVVNPLRIDQDSLNELNYNLLLCYTGKTRLSANIVERQTKAFLSGNKKVEHSLEGLKEIAIEMKNTLLKGQINEFGLILNRAWRYKKNLDKAISNKQIDLMYETAKEKGAIGGKILGAGGGGYLLLFCNFKRKHDVADLLHSMGGEVVPFGFTKLGLETWESFK